MLATINSLNRDKERLIEITVDGTITEVEIHDFLMIQDSLEKMSMAISALRLWVEQKIAEGIIDKSLLADNSQTKKKHINRIGWDYPSRCSFRITVFTTLLLITNHQGGREWISLSDSSMLSACGRSSRSALLRTCMSTWTARIAVSADAGSQKAAGLSGA